MQREHTHRTEELRLETRDLHSILAFIVKVEAIQLTSIASSNQRIHVIKNVECSFFQSLLPEHAANTKRQSSERSQINSIHDHLNDKRARASNIEALAGGGGDGYVNRPLSTPFPYRPRHYQIRRRHKETEALPRYIVTPQ
jgi:hypothetical protein